MALNELSIPLDKSIDHADEITPGTFHYTGLYRVQSRKKEVFSEIKGSWWKEESTLCSDGLSTYLKQHPLWKGKAVVQMRSADVSYRSGLFLSDPDILVKKQFFTPAQGTQVMNFDFVDVNKSYQFWKGREKFVEALFASQAEELLSLISYLKSAIVNEYYCHEAGHCLGYDVRSKYEDGYFTSAGKSLWPLIFVEEFRADLHSFRIAAEILPRSSAVAIFVYNLLLRWGVEAESLSVGKNAYGSVPYLLFHFLYCKGAICIKNKNLALTTTDPNSIIDLMLEAGDHAYRQLTAFEMEDENIDAAIKAANYFRQRILDKEVLQTYEKIFMRFKQS